MHPLVPVYPLRDVVVVVEDGLSPFEFAVGCEVFGIDRSAQGLPSFDFAVCSPRGPAGPPVRATTGFSIVADHDYTRAERADLVLVPASSEGSWSEELNAVLRATVDRGGRVASFCAGAFTLAGAGLLDGRRATTHWFHSDRFRRAFPAVELVEDVLWVDAGPVLTSAGTAAAIDLCLHLVREAYGAATANGIARRMVVPPHRDGGQAQFVDSPVRAREAVTLAPLLDWAMSHLDEDLSVSRLAAHAAMSERTLARRFTGETGRTPHSWVLDQRIALAQRLLEDGDEPVEVIARRCGFGSATMLRHHFASRRSTSPSAYRKVFRGSVHQRATAPA